MRHTIPAEPEDDLVYGPTGHPLDCIPPAWLAVEQPAEADDVAVLPVAGERLLTAQEAARYLGVHANTVYDAAKSGRLSFRAIGRLRRFTVEDLDAWTRRSA